MNIGDRIPEVLGIDQHGNEISVRTSARSKATTSPSVAYRSTSKKITSASVCSTL